jgi:acid phosphatase (class A)
MLEVNYRLTILRNMRLERDDQNVGYPLNEEEVVGGQMPLNGLALGAAAIFVLAGFDISLPTTNPDDLKAPLPGFVPGYLPVRSLIDSLALLPPPPAPSSSAQAADEETYRETRKLVNTPRWQLAARDAELNFPKAADAFSCALGVSINADATPQLNMLLRRVLFDAGFATFKAKNRYNRMRPFVYGNDTICTPEQEETFRKDGSYPSGHAAVGWAWALVLTQLAPERADVLAQRGYAFGQSRVICGVHWQSDVTAGRTVGSAVFAQLQSNPDFVAQLGEARKEVAAAHARNAEPTADVCLIEEETHAN